MRSKKACLLCLLRFLFQFHTGGNHEFGRTGLAKGLNRKCHGACERQAFGIFGARRATTSSIKSATLAAASGAAMARAA